MTKLWTEEATTRGGYKVTAYEYAPGTTDYSSLILPAKDAAAEVLLALPSGPDGLAMMKQIKELGWNASVYFLIRAPDPPTFGENLGVDSDGVFLLPGWNNGLPYAGVKEMAAAYKEKYGKPAAALTGPAYSCVQILADAITRAASLDRDRDPRRDRRDESGHPGRQRAVQGGRHLERPRPGQPVAGRQAGACLPGRRRACSDHLPGGSLEGPIV